VIRVIVAIASGDVVAGAALATGNAPRRYGWLIDAAALTGLTTIVAGLAVLAVLQARHGRYDTIRHLMVAAFLLLAIAAFVALPVASAAAAVASWTVALIFALPQGETP
jgi:hypothetical protein